MLKLLKIKEFSSWPIEWVNLALQTDMGKTLQEERCSTRYCNP